MTQKKYLVALLVIPLFAVIFMASPLQITHAELDELRCMEGEVPVKRVTNPTPICVAENTADRWVALGIAEKVGQPKIPKEVAKTAAKKTEAEKAAEKYTPPAKEMKEPKTAVPKSEMKDDPKASSEEKMKEQEKAAMTPKKDTKAETMEEAKRLSQLEKLVRQVKTGTMTSSQDPGVGHESHQLAIILPPSDSIYRGQLTYSASENVQLVALHGPLKAGEAKGQPTWSPDGKTKFALTFVEPGNSMGTWQFSGNAIAVHTMNETPFTVTYSVAYSERALDDKTISGTVTSMQDPGLGHESHQLAIIVPPSKNVVNAYLTYSATENVQVVALLGPLEKGQVKGQSTWTSDGETYYALMLIDPKKSSGSTQISGNAIALHTMNPTPFTASYSLVQRN